MCQQRALVSSAHARQLYKNVCTIREQQEHINNLEQHMLGEGAAHGVADLACQDQPTNKRQEHNHTMQKCCCTVLWRCTAEFQTCCSAGALLADPSATLDHLQAPHNMHSMMA